VPVLSSAEYRLKYYDGQVYLCPANDPTSSPITEQEVPLNKPFQLPLGYFTLVSDGLEARKPITVRSRKPGERVALDSNRPSQPLKRLFKEWGVPPWWRNQVPLFECGGVLVGVLDQLVDVSVHGARARVNSLQQIIWQPISHLE
jgi:tRNA(Ile)-lysidine synthase